MKRIYSKIIRTSDYPYSQQEDDSHPIPFMDRDSWMPQEPYKTEGFPFGVKDVIQALINDGEFESYEQFEQFLQKQGTKLEDIIIVTVERDKADGIMEERFAPDDWYWVVYLHVPDPENPQAWWAVNMAKDGSHARVGAS